MYRIAYYNRVKQRTAVFRNSHGLFNNIRQIKQIHYVNQFYISVIRKNELENHIDESIWVEIQGKGTRFLLCSTYRPEWTDADYWTRLNHAIRIMYRIAYYNRVKQRTAVFRNSHGLFNNIRQIKQIHYVNQFIVMRSK
jgi:hypothetical protein